MLPRFSRVKQQTATTGIVLLNIRWGTSEFEITLSKKPLVSELENALYPHQRMRNLVALFFMLLVHVVIAYFLLHKKVERPIKQGDRSSQLVFLDLQASNSNASKKQSAFAETIVPAKPAKKLKKRSDSRSLPRSEPVSKSVTKNQPPTKPVLVSPEDTLSQITVAREKRAALEAEQQGKEADLANNLANTHPSENDLALARIKANIQAANYNRKGTNGIFQVLNKGVQTGRFSFRGWTNNAREVTWRTYEVDAGVGGDVERALIRRMIELIREHYSGDFNWDSSRLGRVVVLSARPKDTASLEKFMMKEFFDTK